MIVMTDMRMTDEQQLAELAGDFHGGDRWG